MDRADDDRASGGLTVVCVALLAMALIASKLALADSTLVAVGGY